MGNVYMYISAELGETTTQILIQGWSFSWTILVSFILQGDTVIKYLPVYMG